MTAEPSEKQPTASNGAAPQPVSSDFVQAHERELEGQSHAAYAAHANASELPQDLQRALRAARTPLIEGVDFHAHRAPQSSDPTAPRSAPAEKSRIDTLSPRESVPPPAPFPMEPPPARPAVVPPVRLPYNDPIIARSRSDPPPRAIRSDPPPRIPISDRPSRPVYRSDPPPRLSNSDPPPRSSRSDPPPRSSRRSFADSMSGTSEEARRREAVTIPADSHSPTHAQAYDPSLPLPPLRAPSFPVDQRSLAIRQHENNRLRNVAMTMMFVIFIVTGALAGMRWLVDRDSDTPATASDTPTERSRVSRVQDNELPSDHAQDPTPTKGQRPDDAPSTATGTSPVGPKSATISSRGTKGGPSPDTAEPTASRTVSRDPTGVSSPWPKDAGGAATVGPERKPKRAGASSSAGKNDSNKTNKSRGGKKPVDTKTPLLAD